ncbi:MAG TPA: hypothetical protein VJ831_11395 [Jatrophihabitantaceae bacterium]|nr:hypothetical protein [Jatrophihabitantaceae bacterium]
MTTERGSAAPLTVIVEPDSGGHRFQYVRHVALYAGQYSDVLLLTSFGAGATEQFRNYLADVPLKVEERFDGIYPPVEATAGAIADVCRSHTVSAALVMDADQSLKRWWLVAPRQLRSIKPKPRIIFLLTRYPAKLRLRDRFGWMHRIAKGSLSVAAMATRSLSRVVTLAGRDDMSKGTLVKRVRDPAICDAHSRDRAAIRAALDLPADRRIVGIFGRASARKNVPLVATAVMRCSDDAILLLAGPIDADVTEWVAAQSGDVRERILMRDGFLPNDLLDQLVAASDVVAIAQNNNGPSGIMGKALAAGVPVLSAGSMVRLRELRATRAGLHVDMHVDSLASGFRKLFEWPPLSERTANVPPATAESFARGLLGR